MSRLLQVTLEDDLDDRMMKVVKERRVSRTQIVVWAVEQWLADPRLPEPPKEAPHG